MQSEEVRQVVGITLQILKHLTGRTRTQADDLMAGILEANRERLVEAVTKLVAQGQQPPSDEQISQALNGVGIRA